ncbi:hypothetical protein [Sphingomonas parapaucimobilis]|uniref:hypothetical protein n=1 Tax=Sphingomonas parapaucimobilis TaxID=28213 RepID=UPI00391DB327
MATTAPDEQLYTFRIPAIRRSIEQLAGMRTHEQLPGYLALLHGGVAQGRVDLDASYIATFYRTYLAIDGLPDQKPYLQPFRSRGTGITTSNKNTSGSYSGASIREGRPLSHVLEVVKSNKTRSGVAYRLKLGHATAVLSEMLVGNKIPAVALSAFFFRDHALSMGSPEPSQVIEALRSWLHIDAGRDAGDEVFDTIFRDDSAEYAPTDFERYEG